MRQQKWHTRGGRISGKGFRLAWVAVGLIPVMLVAGMLHAPSPVDYALLVLMVVAGVTGIGIALYGNAVTRRDLADYYQRVAAGEEPARATAGQAAVTGERGPGLAAGGGRDRRAEAAERLAVLQAAPRYAAKGLAMATLSALSLCAAAVCVVLSAGPQPRLGWLAAAVAFLLLCIWSAVVTVRLHHAEHRLSSKPARPREF